MPRPARQPAGLTIQQRAIATAAAMRIRRETELKEIDSTKSMALPEPHSIEQRMFIESECDVTIYGGRAGGGKCQVLCSQIVTSNGFVTVGDIQVGETVFDERGVPCSVLSSTRRTHHSAAGHRHRGRHENPSRDGTQGDRQHEVDGAA